MSDDITLTLKVTLPAHLGNVEMRDALRRAAEDAGTAIMFNGVPWPGDPVYLRGDAVLTLEKP